MPIRGHFIGPLLLLAVALSPMAHAAEKLNGFYSGSGGISADVHRVLLIEFAADGSAIPSAEVAHNRSPNLARQLEQERNKVTITFDPTKHN